MSVPPRIVAASLAALGLHDPAIPVAHLVGDSLIDDNVPLTAGTHRRLLFAGDDLSAEVAIVHVGRHRRLRVEVDPADFEELVLAQPGNGVHQHVSDQAVDLAAVDPGLTSLVLRRRGGLDPRRTAWVLI